MFITGDLLFGTISGNGGLNLGGTSNGELSRFLANETPSSGSLFGGRLFVLNAMKSHYSHSGEISLKSILNVVIPPVRTYQYLAYPLSIILAHKEAWSWFYCNFIQMYSTDNEQIHMHDTGGFDNYPWLIVNEVKLSSIRPNLIDWIPAMIDEEHYVYFFLDEFYIEGTRSYQQDHYIHDLLIHGYDLEQNVAHVSGYMADGQYACYTVPFLAIVQAVEATDELYRKTITFKYRKYAFSNYTYLSGSFDLFHLIGQLSDYLNSVNSPHWVHLNSKLNPFKYGMQVYQVLRKQIQLAEQKQHINIHAFYCVYEHHAVMKDRLYFLGQTLQISLASFQAQAEELVKKAIVIKNLVLKYNLTGQAAFLPAIQSKVDELEVSERSFLCDLLAELTLYSNNKRHMLKLEVGHLQLEEQKEELVARLYDCAQFPLNHPLIYNAMADLSVSLIRGMYDYDRVKIGYLLSVFFDSIMEREWHPLHLRWFAGRCEELFAFVKERERLLHCLEMVAEKCADPIVYKVYERLKSCD
ncbi:hypothetical protein [Cohnella soli]|uniref:Uncharacterized protein n=1 Tax=Cohnella soli TaxID=425005 RepID=A0ABW0I3X1_9BACL